MKATIWHNPKCGTSRNALAILQETPDIDLTVIDYLKTPYTRDRIAGLIAAAGLTPQQALRLRGTDAEEQGLPSASDDVVLDAMVANSAYVERPFVETEKGVRLCRPLDRIHEIL